MFCSRNYMINIPVEIVSADMGDVTTPLGIAQNQL
jgi:hypothetical protein